MVPESQAYMDLLTFEKKLDSTIMRKRLEIQEAIRRPMKRKRKLRVFIAHQFSTPESEKVCSVLLIPVSHMLYPGVCASMGTADQREIIG